MPKREYYETLGTLITNGAEVALDTSNSAGKYKDKRLNLDSNFLIALRDALLPYASYKDAEIITAKLAVVIARQDLDWCEEDLKKLEKRA